MIEAVSKTTLGWPSSTNLSNSTFTCKQWHCPAAKAKNQQVI